MVHELNHKDVDQLEPKRFPNFTTILV